MLPISPGKLSAQHAMHLVELKHVGESSRMRSGIRVQVVAQRSNDSDHGLYRLFSLLMAIASTIGSAIASMRGVRLSPVPLRPLPLDPRDLQ